MPQYALLIYGPAQPYDELDADQSRQMYERHAQFGRMLEERGAIRGGAELELAGRILRERDGEVVVSDGPFAEATEVLGGFYLVEAADLDEATELGRAVPVLPTDVVEVRKVMGPSDRPS